MNNAIIYHHQHAELRQKHHSTAAVHRVAAFGLCWKLAPLSGREQLCCNTSVTSIPHWSWILLWIWMTVTTSEDPRIPPVGFRGLTEGEGLVLSAEFKQGRQYCLFKWSPDNAAVFLTPVRNWDQIFNKERQQRLFRKGYNKHIAFFERISTLLFMTFKLEW